MACLTTIIIMTGEKGKPYVFLCFTCLASFPNLLCLFISVFLLVQSEYLSLHRYNGYIVVDTKDEVFFKYWLVGGD